VAAIAYIWLHQSAESGEWFWSAISHNGRIVANHGNYNDERSAREGIALNYGSDYEIRMERG
jgi:uncharacterized protein YegP (UPF0339 family)